MSTNWISKTSITRKWFIIDAKDLVLGRLASYLAFHLMGKQKTTYSPNLDCGDYYIIVNADKIIMTGNKLEKKCTESILVIQEDLRKFLILKYYLVNILREYLKLSVKRMLPKGPLGRDHIKKLHIYQVNLILIMLKNLL